MASISTICKKSKNFISALKSPTYIDFMIKKSLKSKTSKSHTWAPLRGFNSNVGITVTEHGTGRTWTQGMGLDDKDGRARTQ
jgi:hypothetical protein